MYRIKKYYSINQLLDQELICQNFEEIASDNYQKKIIGKGKESTIYEVAIEDVYKCAFKFIPYNISDKYQWRNTGDPFDRKWIYSTKSMLDFFTKSVLGGFPHFPMVYKSELCLSNHDPHTDGYGLLYILYELFDGDPYKIVTSNNSFDTWVSIFFQFYLINYFLEIKKNIFYSDGKVKNHLYTKNNPYVYKYVIKTKEKVYTFYLKHKYFIVIWDIHEYKGEGRGFFHNFQLLLDTIEQFNRKNPNQFINLPKVFSIATKEINQNASLTPMLIEEFFPHLTEEKTYDKVVEIDLLRE